MIRVKFRSFIRAKYFIVVNKAEFIFWLNCAHFLFGGFSDAIDPRGLTKDAVDRNGTGAARPHRTAYRAALRGASLIGHLFAS